MRKVSKSVATRLRGNTRVGSSPTPSAKKPLIWIEWSDTVTNKDTLRTGVWTKITLKKDTAKASK